MTSFTGANSSGCMLGVALQPLMTLLSGSVERLGGVLCQAWLLKTLLKWDDYLFMQGLKSVFICAFFKFYLCVALRHVIQ